MHTGGELESCQLILAARFRGEVRLALLSGGLGANIATTNESAES